MFSESECCFTAKEEKKSDIKRSSSVSNSSCTFTNSIMTQSAQRKRSNLISDYEQMHNDNLADNKLVLARLLAEFRMEVPVPVEEEKQPRKVRKCFEKNDTNFVRRNPIRSSRRSYGLSSLAPASRSRRGSVSSTVSSSSSISSVSPAVSPEKLLIRFPFFKRPPISDTDSIDYMDDPMDSAEHCLPDNRRMARIPSQDKSADEITEEDMALVAQFVSEKKYDSSCGTSCHQCRQKTSDMKTICRSGKCFGIRGQFCGPCLKNRYGEEATDALKNPNWMCPPCRGICNCSFCRKKKGRSCTGIMIHQAREMGYSNVSDYLLSLKKK